MEGGNGSTKGTTVIFEERNEDVERVCVERGKQLCTDAEANIVGGG